MTPIPPVDTKYMWQHTWPSAEVLCEFIATNPKLWHGKAVLELGAGATALPSMTAIRCGASKVVITEQSRLEKALDHIRCNIERNFEHAKIQEHVCIMGLDWLHPEEALGRLADETPQLDFIFGSDVFYDPCVFEPLVLLLRRFFNLFPNLEMYMAYQIRDSDWSIEELLAEQGLCCNFIRCVDTDQHSVCLGKITQSIEAIGRMSEAEGPKVFAGVEGGATHSTLVLVNSVGTKLGEWNDGPGLNFLLNGVEKTADRIAGWVRTSVTEGKAKLPLLSLGMGLSGAEDEGTNRRMLAYLKAQHADVADAFFLTSDSIAAVATSFDNGGVVLIAGTGSACRLLKANGDVHGVGGWGHLIGDGGGGFWITMRAVRRIFDVEDGLIRQDADGDFGGSEADRIAAVKGALLRHFRLDSKLALLEILYSPTFSKSFVASFCKKLAELALSGDQFARELFGDAGDVLAQHLVTVCRHFDAEMLREVPVVLIGSVFNSWALIRDRFEDHLRRANTAMGKAERRMGRVMLYRLESTTAIGAAILGHRSIPGIRDKSAGLNSFKKPQSKRLLDQLDLNSSQQNTQM